MMMKDALFLAAILAVVVGCTVVAAILVT